MTAALSPEARRRIRPFVTHVERPVYCLRNLPEEVVAVLFAYYSRSRESLRENLLKLLDSGDLDLGAIEEPEDEAALLAEAREKARAFHEKWVVGYGHSSVAEHAVVHVAVEDVSILASKVIEDARLASFTEKSTRYVPFDTRRFHTPRTFSEPPRADLYQTGIRGLMVAYDRLMEPLVRHFLDTIPRRAGQSERGHATACRAQACDVLRYLLPASTLTNLGLTINARALEALLVKMLSHPLEEVRHYGGLIKEESLKLVPTLVKYADLSAYRAETPRVMRRLAEEHLASAGGPWGGTGDGDTGAPEGEPSSPAGPASGAPPPRARLVHWDPEAEDKILEAILFEASGSPAAEVAQVVKSMAPEARQRLLNEYMSRRTSHEAPLRALEQADYTFEIVVDYGAYRDIQRHRMAGQFPQRLGVDLGYERPPQIDAAGMADDFDRAMEQAARAHLRLAADCPEEAQYVVPLAYRKRMLFRMNLRELHHFIPLRSSPQGHPSYRRVAQAIYHEVARVHPGLASFLRVDLSEYELSRG